MISLWRIILLEFVSLWRTKTFAILATVTVAWMLFLPEVVASDGTVEGVRELLIRYSFGGAFIIVVIALVSIATGVIATERAARRLQLTQVRPVGSFTIAWGKFFALTLAGAIVLALDACVLYFQTAGISGVCHHAFSPVLERPEVEAAKMYEAYMADPETPDEVKKTKKSIVLRLLAQRAKDHYQTVCTNECAEWKINSGLGEKDTNAVVSARFRFSNDFDMRQDVLGKVRYRNWFGVVSNITQSVITVPLSYESYGECIGECDGLLFDNRGKSAVMLRPRVDVQLLVEADSYLANLARSYVVMVSLLALVIAFGTLLGAGLSRPVALFSALVILAASEMSPSIIDQYPDQLETDRVDRIGLAITRFVGKATKSISASSPLERLAVEDAVEGREVLESVFRDVFVAPGMLIFIAAFLLSRKHWDD